MSAVTEADTIDLAEVGRALRRGWRAVLAFTVLGAVVAAAVILFAPPRFTGTASLVLKTGSDPGASVLSRLSGGLSDAGGMLSGALKSPMETELQILSSRAVAGRVVDSLLLQGRVTTPRGVPTNHIVQSYALAPAFAPRTYHFTRFTRVSGSVYKVDGTTAQVAAGASLPLPIGTVALRSDVNLPAFDLEFRDREDAIKRVSKHLVVDKVGGEVAKVSYEGDDSLSAASVPNALVAIYLARRTTTDRGANQHRLEFIVAKADSAAAALSAAERALRRQQESSGVIDPQVVGKIELERAAQMRASLTDLQVENGTITLLIARVVNGSIKPRELVAYPTFLKSPGINNLLSELSQVETDRFKMLESRTEKDPEVLALTRSAANLESQLLPLARTYSASLGKQRADLEHGLDTLQTKIAGLPAVAESGLRLQRDVLLLGQVYGALQAQLVEARLSALEEGGNVRTLDTAVPPKQPAFPNPLLTAGLGIAGGLGCGLVAALLIGMLGRWMHDPQQVERSTGLPAMRFDAAVPLLIGNEASQTVLIIPLDPRARVEPVARQIVQTALARSMSATLLDLSSLETKSHRALPSLTPPAGGAQPIDVNASIERLEQDYRMVIVQLPGIGAPATIAALRRSRPVVLVVPERRIDRAELMGAVQTLRRLDVPCAGIVLSGADGNGVLAG